MPERLDLKHSVLAEIDAACPPDALDRLLDLGLHADATCRRGSPIPERLVVAHPFNPVYLLPLVEIVGGKATDRARGDRARRGALRRASA